jgi:hypothetical protein
VLQSVINNLQKLINKETTVEKRNTHAFKSAMTEKKLVQKLHNKLELNNLILTKADKGNTVIIIPKDTYYIILYHNTSLSKYVTSTLMHNIKP